MAESYRRRSVDATCAGDWELAADLSDKCTIYLQNVQILVDRAMADTKRQRLNKYPDEKPNFSQYGTYGTVAFEGARCMSMSEIHDNVEEARIAGTSVSDIVSEFDEEALRYQMKDY